MNILSTIHFLCMLTYLFLIYFVLLQNPKRLINKVCAMFLTCFALWCFGKIFTHRIDTPETTALFFMYIVCIGAWSFSSFFLWFILIFTEKDKIWKNWIFMFLIFFIPALLLILQFTNQSVLEYIPRPYGWGIKWKYGIWAILLHSHIVIALLISLILSVIYWRRTDNKEKKIQAKLFFIGTIIPSIIGITLNIYFPWFNNKTIPDLAQDFSVIWGVIIVYSIVKYNFLTINPKLASENIVSTMNDALILLDKKMNIVTINRSAESLFNIKKDEILFKPLKVIFSKSNQYKKLKYNIKNHHLIKNFYIKMIKDNKVHYSNISTSILKDRNKNILGTILIANDITKLKSSEFKLQKALKKIRESSQQKSIFFNNIAHELKTPLTLINNYLEQYIQKKGLSNELQSIKENIDDIQNNIDNILDVEKFIHKNKVYNHDSIINVSEIVNSKILLFSEIAKNKKIIIKKEINNQLFVMIDPRAMDRIINNLIDNALRYTNSNGNIFIKLEGNKNDIRFIVKDTGIGINDEQIKNIFKPYYQISREKSNFQGLGLGLYIIKKITEEIDGDILITSNQNEGTEIIITLKRIFPENKEIILKNYSLTIPKFKVKNFKLIEGEYQDNKRTILIVEDNIEMLLYLQQNLIFKYNIFYALNGKEALNKLSFMPKPNLIISDIMMDKKDGYEFYKDIAQNNEYNIIPFIFLTAKSSISDRIKGLSIGALDYITKPFDINELLLKIDSICKMQNKLKENSYKNVKTKIFNAIRNKQNKTNNNFDEGCLKYNITPREKEIILLVSKGNENKEISNLLNISFETVRTHLKNIYKKCNVQNKIELLNILK